MPRTARAASQSGIYHVMFRGNELSDIFIDDEDRAKFLQTLFKKVQDEKFVIYAYCLMDNHVHLLIKGEHGKLGNLIKRINTGYVYYFNKKYGRVGHLFQDRFRSEPVDTESYFFDAVRYIHNNPVKACMVTAAGEYFWSSYNDYINISKNPCDSIDTKYFLSTLSNDNKKAIGLFKELSKKETEKCYLEPRNIDTSESGDSKPLKGEVMTRQYVGEYVKRVGIKINDLKLKIYRDIREQLIMELKHKSDQSKRNIAIILDVNRGIVQRTCQRTVP